MMYILLLSFLSPYLLIAGVSAIIRKKLYYWPGLLDTKNYIEGNQAVAWGFLLVFISLCFIGAVISNVLQDNVDIRLKLLLLIAGSITFYFFFKNARDMTPSDIKSAKRHNMIELIIGIIIAIFLVLQLLPLFNFLK